MEEPDNLDHVTIVTKTRGFSKGTDGLMFFSARNETEIICNLKILKGWYDMEVFLNGNLKENLGYVSVTVRNFYNRKYFWSCIISVMDSSGNSFFPQSFTISELSFRDIHVGRLIGREALLGDSQLLPEDTLTLKFEIYNMTPAEGSLVRVDRYRIFRSYFEEVCENDESEFYLLFDSPLTKRLVKESPYFQIVLAAPTIERITKRTKIVRHEYTAFLNIRQYLFGAERLAFHSIDEIFDMFVVADKYIIPIIAELCVCFLKLCLTDHDAHLIESVCRKIVDVAIFEKLDNELREYWCSEENGDAKQSAMTLTTTQRVRDRVWTYKHDRNEPLRILCFETKDMKTKISIKDQNEASFSFYH